MAFKKIRFDNINISYKKKIHSNSCGEKYYFLDIGLIVFSVQSFLYHVIFYLITKYTKKIINS